MKEIVYFFTPFFNSVLFNHQNIALVELAFLFSILLFDILRLLTAEKPKTGASFALFLVITSLFLSASYILFSELTWWKSLVNILVSVIAFKLISLIIIFPLQVSFHGFYRYKSPESEGILKRRAFVFISIIVIVAITLNVMIKNIVL